MTQVATVPFQHVANGHSVTQTLEAAGVPGALSIWADPLHDGPVPGGLSDEELLDVRARHLAHPTYAEAVDGLREWRNSIDHHDAYDELVLWYEHDLFDQLNLIQLLSRIPRHLPASKPVSLVCLGSFPGKPRFKGLGELMPGELAPLLETRQRVSEAQYAVADRAWRAFREPTPEALNEIVRSDTSALPFLGAALRRFLEEYPWTRDGLSRRERRLLELANQGPADLVQAYLRMDDSETAYHITDTSFADVVEDLSHTSPPLISAVHEGTYGESALPRGSMTLTEMGTAVLRGTQDRIAVCGIDRWFGGVHVHAGDIWRWDEDRERVVRG